MNYTESTCTTDYSGIISLLEVQVSRFLHGVRQNVYEIEPPQVEFLIQNTISKFSKTKNQTKKDLLKFQKNQNIYNDASNQKIL